MAELSKEEIIEKNRQSVKKTAKICIIIFAVAAAVCIVIAIIQAFGGPKVEYEVVSTQEYVRDNQKCMAYRVYVKEKPTKEQAQKIWKQVTRDSYYLHIVWFYDDKSAATGTDGYKWKMEQTKKGTMPAFY